MPELMPVIVMILSFSYVHFCNCLFLPPPPFFPNCVTGPGWLCGAVCGHTCCHPVFSVSLGLSTLFNLCCKQMLLAPCGNTCFAAETNEAGLLGAAADLLFHRAHDLSKPQGLILAISLILSMPRGGIVVMAPCCGSWVWINKGTSKRSALNPLGNESVNSVRLGNLFAARCAILALLCSACSIEWIVEQPGTSSIGSHPRWWVLKKAVKVYTGRFWMGSFGSSTRKRTVLWSSSADLIRPICLLLGFCVQIMMPNLLGLLNMTTYPEFLLA